MGDSHIWFLAARGTFLSGYHQPELLFCGTRALHSAATPFLVQGQLRLLRQVSLIDDAQGWLSPFAFGVFGVVQETVGQSGILLASSLSKTMKQIINCRNNVLNVYLQHIVLHAYVGILLIWQKHSLQVVVLLKWVFFPSNMKFVMLDNQKNILKTGSEIFKISSWLAEI